MFNRFLKFLGFDHAAERTRQLRKRRKNFDDDDDIEEEYEEEIAVRERPVRQPVEGIVFFKGLANDDDKLRLRDALLDGCVVIIDLAGITMEQKDIGIQFITFMSGVAFANRGEFLKLGPTLFSVSPRMGMVQTVMGGAAGHVSQGVRDDG